MPIQNEILISQCIIYFICSSIPIYLTFIARAKRGNDDKEGATENISGALTKNQVEVRIQVYYAITEKGLKALLYYDDFEPIKFWEILHGYCQYSDEIVMLDKIEEFYQIVIRRYLKHYVHEFSFQLDIFDYICNNWFQKTIVMSNGITPLQKVIEILASYPKITFERLLEEIDEPKKLVKEILRVFFPLR